MLNLYSLACVYTKIRVHTAGSEYLRDQRFLMTCFNASCLQDSYLVEVIL